MQNLMNYLRCKWKFILAMAILLVLNYFAWSFLWEEPTPEPEPEQQAEPLPSNVT